MLSFEAELPAIALACHGRGWLLPMHEDIVRVRLRSNEGRKARHSSIIYFYKNFLPATLRLGQGPTVRLPGWTLWVALPVVLFSSRYVRCLR